MKIDPNKTFFLVMSVGTLDGKIDTGAEVPYVAETEDEAISHAESVATEYDLDTYVYRCQPVSVSQCVKVRTRHLDK